MPLALIRVCVLHQASTIPPNNILRSTAVHTYTRLKKKNINHLASRDFIYWEMDKVGIPRGGKMQTSFPPVITPNRSQSNPDDMITLPRPIQSVGMDLHDVSGTSTGQTLPRERRAPPGTHFCPTIWWVYPHSATIFILHTLLSTFSSTFVRNIKQQLQGSCARVRRIQNARRRNHLRMVRGGAQTHTRSAAVTDV